VLLYELLTGTTPFAKEQLSEASYDEMRRIIREDEPPRPSDRISTLQAELLSTVSERHSSDPRKITQTVRGELDWIVMKALEKDRTRRYESASALAADIQRYLDDEAVEACPPSTSYRLRKSAWRNRTALTTATVVALFLLVGTGVSIWQARRAIKSEKVEEERLAQAQQSFEQALQAVNQMLTRVGNQRLNDVPQMKTVRAELLQDAMKFYCALLEQDSGNSTVRYRMAVAQVSLGSDLKILERSPDAEAAYREAIATLDDLVQQFPVEPE